ncbi:MAG: SDR family oxidoreductase [Verrucomicrobiota bacterium]
MNSTGNTILITGGASGIGRGLAEAFQRLGNQVIIAGRGKKSLDQTAAANPGMKSLRLDLTRPKSIQTFVEQVREFYPTLNVLINNAGVMEPENLRETAGDLSTAENTVTTNLLGPIRLTASLLPLLEKQENATIINVSSGLAFVPLAMTPTYCATKAGLHSFTQSLRYQLRETKVQVIELIPPYVATTLMGEQQASDPQAMPLEEFIGEAMEILQTQPKAKEVNVKKVLPLRQAADDGEEHFEQFFQQFNDSMHK